MKFCKMSWKLMENLMFVETSSIFIKFRHFRKKTTNSVPVKPVVLASKFYLRNLSLLIVRGIVWIGCWRTLPRSSCWNLFAAQIILNIRTWKRRQDSCWRRFVAKVLSCLILFVGYKFCFGWSAETFSPTRGNEAEILAWEAGGGPVLRSPRLAIISLSHPLNREEKVTSHFRSCKSKVEKNLPERMIVEGGIFSPASSLTQTKSEASPRAAGVIFTQM